MKGAENEKQLNVRSDNNWLGSSKVKKKVDSSCSLHWLSNKNAVTNHWCSRDLEERESFQVRHYPCKRVEEAAKSTTFTPIPHISISSPPKLLTSSGKWKKIKKTVSLLEIQEVNLSFNKNLYSSSILYYIRNPIMQPLSPIHKTPPQNLAALYKICLWLLLLEEGPRWRSLTDSSADEL